jgi:alpha-1,2-glucosyltransferase
LIWIRSGVCTTGALRHTNGPILLLLGLIAYACRATIESEPGNRQTKKDAKSWKLQVKGSAYAIHTAVNIALFPPLFFFSGLYYTDVLSTCVVLLAYREFLQRKGAYTNSTTGSFTVFVTGLLSLLMRQTNIFWVAVFMGALEVMRCIEAMPKRTVRKKKSTSAKEAIMAEFESYNQGNIHDPELSNAGIEGKISTNLLSCF